MNLTERWSTSTRLTLSNAGVIVLCFVILAGTVISYARYFMREHIRESVDAELHIMVREHSLDGQRGLTQLIRFRLQGQDPEHQRVYRLEDDAGRTLIGNLAQWPAAGAGQRYLSLPSQAHPGETQVIARSARLADGSRLLVGYDEYELRHLEERINQVALSSLVLVIVMALLAGRQITRNALRPIAGMRRSAQQIMNGDLDHRLQVSGSTDEFDALSSTLNDMLDRIAQLIRGIKGTTDNIAHDLRSPLTRHRARLEAAQQQRPSAEAWPEWVDSHLRDIDQVLSTFQSLLRLASIDSGVLRGAFAPTDLNQLCHDAAEFMEALTESRGQALVLTLPDSPVKIAGHRDLLFQLLINLLDNASKYSPEHSEIHLSLSSDRARWHLSLSDAGPGIPAAERDKVFERLYRLDQTRQTPGLGLGLSLVKGIVLLHGGSIRLADAHPGLRVEIDGPIAP